MGGGPIERGRGVGVGLGSSAGITFGGTAASSCGDGRWASCHSIALIRRRTSLSKLALRTSMPCCSRIRESESGSSWSPGICAPSIQSGINGIPLFRAAYNSIRTKSHGSSSLRRPASSVALIQRRPTIANINWHCTTSEVSVVTKFVPGTILSTSLKI